MVFSCLAEIDGGTEIVVIGTRGVEAGRSERGEGGGAQVKGEHCLRRGESVRRDETAGREKIGCLCDNRNV